jgi:UDP-N-acetylglucosamine--N-acetylmuramyl-(pentapeptide) pyrophosphoryl-undecaprenol N-acetylglucosamine transferase
MAYVGIGFVQSMIKMIIWRPDVVFTKGGYVCLPIGIAAKVLGIPLVIHDSDAHPGLTNRVLAKWAVAIGTGAPLKFYPYPVSKAKYVGVPIVADFSPFDASKQAEAKQRLGFSPSRPLVVVTGGGLGAQRLNEAIALNLHTLLAYTNVILISGEGQYDDMRALTPQDDDRYQLHAFVSKGMAEMLGAATVVVTRAGATTILELAALAKPTILVPNAYLTGGHQLKNAAVYEESGAVLVVNETDIERDPGVLEHAIKRVITDEALQSNMSKAFESFAKPHSAKEMAELITGAIKRS